MAAKIKNLIAMILVTGLSGCTFAGEKWDRYKEAAHMAGNPDRIHIEYHREGNETSFYEWRCSGKMCPNDDSR